MRYLLICLLLFGLAAVAAPPALAQDAPYSATVPVPDTSDAQRDHAFAVALGEVLGRATGRDLSAQAQYSDVLGSARSYVQQYQYRRAPAGSPQPFELQVSFDAASVQHLVTRLGATASNRTRAPVLLSVRGADGQLLGPVQLQALTAPAEGSGIDFAFADAGSTPDREALRRADGSALAAVAQRYHTGMILLGTLRHGSADWTLVDGGKLQQWGDSGSVEAMLGEAGTALAQRLARGPAMAGGGDSVLWVSGIESSDDFASALAMLRAGRGVDNVAVQQAGDNGMLLQVHTRAPLDVVVDDLGASGRLLPAAQAHAGADASLHWLR